MSVLLRNPDAYSKVLVQHASYQVAGGLHGMRRWVLILALGLLSVGCKAPPDDPGLPEVPATSDVAPGQYTVLDAALAATVTNQCSRPAPEIEGSWTPSADDVSTLEERLPHVEMMETRICCSVDEDMDDAYYIADVNAYYRQYVGVVVGERRLIYINAFLKEEAELLRNWRTEPVLVCDGGPGYWGVLYDPQTGDFEQLATSGTV